MMRAARYCFVALLAALSLARAAEAQERLNVVTTFSLLADLAKNVGGERVRVSSLVGLNSDAHVYSPKPADARTLSAANVVITNGLGFEGWLDRLIKASGAKGVVVVASRGIKPRRQTQPSDHGHSHRGDADPHAWQSVGNVKTYVTNIRDALAKADPAGRSVYEANASQYLARLEALNADIRSELASIAPDRRKVAVTHNAFAYFEEAYGVSFFAVHGVSTESEPSAGEVAKMIARIRREGVRAVFLENVTDPRLLDRIAREAGVKIGGTLYSDALTDEKGPAPSYIDMMRHNVRQIAAALRP